MGLARSIFCIIFFILICARQHVFAQQPIISNHIIKTLDTKPKELYATAQPIGDPVAIAQGIYGRITADKQVDFYVFLPQDDGDIPLELLVPAKRKYNEFRPTLVFIGKDLASDTEIAPFVLPLGYESDTIRSPVGTRPVFFKLFGFQTAFHGQKTFVHVNAGVPYYLAVYEPNNYLGSYVIEIGNKNNYSIDALDTAPNINPDSIVFDDSLDRSRNDATTPEYEKKLFVKDESPFQIFDSKFRLMNNMFHFFIYRIGDIFN